MHRQIQCSPCRSLRPQIPPSSTKTTSATPLSLSTNASNRQLPAASSTTSPTKLSDESPRLSVIIDSPLSRRTHLYRLLDLAASVGAQLLIEECWPSDVAKWRDRLEGREKSWHKPASWGELQELIKGYDGCSDYDVGNVQRMVVETAEPNIGVEELVSSVVQFIASALCPTPLPM